VPPGRESGSATLSAILSVTIRYNISYNISWYRERERQRQAEREERERERTREHAEFEAAIADALQDAEVWLQRLGGVKSHMATLGLNPKLNDNSRVKSLDPQPIFQNVKCLEFLFPRV